MSGARPGRVVLLAGDGPSTRVVYHHLVRDFPELRVVLEDGVPASQLLKRRMKTLGPLVVLGQVLFMGLVGRRLRRSAGPRVADIYTRFGLSDEPIAGPVVRVPSVNSEEARQALREMQPSVVVVNGTRIIGARTLAAVKVPFINMHAGITPLFRGVHGGYWALAEGRPELVGTTVHLVDEGIDTGNVIEQATCEIGPGDSFATYPALQLAAGLPLLTRAVQATLDGSLEPRARHDLPSRFRSHPTLWGYLLRRLTRGVR